MRRAMTEHRDAVDGFGRPDVLNSTGPLVFTRVLRPWQKDGIMALPESYFYPQLDAHNNWAFGDPAVPVVTQQKRYAERVMAGLDHPQAYTVHHWAGTWTRLVETKRALIERTPM